MELPTKKSGVSRDWKDQKFLMIGPAGIGKSELWSHAEDVLYVEAEAGLNFIDAYKLPCRSWGDVSEIIGKLRSTNPLPYKLVVIDTIDRIIDYANQSIIQYGQEKYPSAEIKAIGDYPGIGTGWYMREAMIKKFLKALEELPCAVAIVGHLENKKVEESGQKAYDKSTISIGGKVGGDILAWSDHTLHIKGVMLGDSLKRTVYTKPTKSREAKSRGGIVADGWIWTEDSKENFDKLREQFT